MIVSMHYTGGTIITVKWKQGDGWESFGVPITRNLSLEKREVCLPGSKNVSRHLFLAKWKSMTTEILGTHSKKYMLPTLDLSFMDVSLEGE